MRRTGDSALGSKDTLGGARFGPQSKRDLVRLCHDVREHIEARNLATPQEIKASWPARKNAKLWDWVYCWAQLSRFTERGKRSSSADADAIAIDVFAERPEVVGLSDDTTVSVYPKSLEVLIWCVQQDELLSWLADRERDLFRSIDSGTLDREVTDAPFDVLTGLAEERTDTLARLTAQVCHPGPELASNLAADRFRLLSPLDIYRINSAFIRVNAARLHALSVLSPHRSQKSKDRPMPWSVAIATAADLWRESPQTLISRRSFAAVLARLQLSAARAVPEEVA